MFVNHLHLDSATDWWGFHTEITTLESFGGKNYFACCAIRKLIAMVHLRARFEYESQNCSVSSVDSFCQKWLSNPFSILISVMSPDTLLINN